MTSSFSLYRRPDPINIIIFLLIAFAIIAGQFITWGCNSPDGKKKAMEEHNVAFNKDTSNTEIKLNRRHD